MYSWFFLFFGVGCFVFSVCEVVCVWVMVVVVCVFLYGVYSDVFVEL